MFPVEQLLMVSAVQKMYSMYGIHGLYYAIYFGWEGSPFRSIEDKQERSERVMAEIFEQEYWDPSKKKHVPCSKMHSKKNPFFQEHTMKPAIEAINSLAPVPQIESYNFLESQIHNLRKEMSKVKVDQNDPNKLSVQMKNLQTLLGNIKDMEKLRDQAMEEISSVMKEQEMCSLNDFIVKVGTKLFEEKLEEV